MTVAEAKVLDIQLSKLNWELLDLTYRQEWEDSDWTERKSGESEVSFNDRITKSEGWKDRKKQYLDSISRRVKYEALLGRVVSKGHIGKVGFHHIYDMEPSEGLDVNYEVISTKPDGEVRVTEETELRLSESDTNW
jgi:hypothetical protein